MYFDHFSPVYKIIGRKRLRQNASSGCSHPLNMHLWQCVVAEPQRCQPGFIGLELQCDQPCFNNRRGTHGGRRCANCRNAHFLRGTVMKASSHEKHAKKQWKNQKNKKKQKVQTHVPCQASPQTLPMGLNFLFFFVFFDFSIVFCMFFM